MNLDTSPPGTSSVLREPAVRARERWIVEWLPELIFVVVSSCVGIWAGGRWLDPIGDPGFSWSVAYRLAEGDLLYRDVYWPYSPLSTYLRAGIGQLFRFSTTWQVLSNWLAAVAAGVLLLRYGRRFLTTLERIALAGLILTFSLWVPGPGRLVLPYSSEVVHALILSLAALLTRANSRLSERTRDWLAGLLGGLVFCIKQEIGLAVLIALLAPAVFQPKRAFSRQAPTLLAFGAVVALGAILVLSSASIETLRERNHLWPFDTVPPADWGQVLRSASGVLPNWAYGLRHAAWELLIQLGLVACFGLLVARERKFWHWVPVLVLAVVLFGWRVVEGFALTSRSPVGLSVTVAFLVAALASGEPAREKREQLLAFAVFAGLAGLRAVFSATIHAHYDGPAHFATSLTWVLFLCVFAPRLLAPGPKATKYARRLTAILLLLGAWNGARVGAESLRSPSKEAVQTPRGTIFLDRWNASFYRSLSRALKPREKVLVLPETNAVDVLFDVQQPSPLLSHFPGWLDTSLEKELIRRFEVNPPDAVVLFNRPLEEFGVARFGDGYGELLSEWIFQNYRTVVKERSGLLLRRRSHDDRGPAPRPVSKS